MKKRIDNTARSTKSVSIKLRSDPKDGLESVWALLKRGYYGTFHHFTTKHLQRYVDEFAFRLNEGRCAVESMDRIDSLFEKAQGVRLTYKDLIRN